MKAIAYWIFIMSLSKSVLAQLKPVEEEKGVLIFQQYIAHTDSIPQDVIFFPLKEITDEPIDVQLQRAIDTNDSTGIVVYFQVFRRRNPDLLSDLQKTRHGKGELREEFLYGGTYKVSVALGIIAFEREPLHGGDIDEKPGIAHLKFEGKDFQFNIISSPAKVGYPMYFKPIE